MGLVDAAAYAVLRPVLRHGVRWTIEGVDHVPRSGPVLVASNHVSYFDPFAIGYALDARGRYVRFLAKAELFRRPVLGRVLRALGQIPVERHDPVHAVDALAAAQRALGRGECVAVFPEGTIPAAGARSPRTGLVRLASAACVPVHPVGVWGGQALVPKGARPRIRPGRTVAVVVGEPMTVGAGDDVHAATRRVMGAIDAAAARARSQVETARAARRRERAGAA